MQRWRKLASAEWWAMSKLRAWTKWEHSVSRKITWAELNLKMEQHHFKFLVQSVFDVLLSLHSVFFILMQ